MASYPHRNQCSALCCVLTHLPSDSSAETSAERPRRQADISQSLCTVRTEYITPRAALNNKGSWKYVVNMPDNMTQLVRAEICT